MHPAPPNDNSTPTIVLLAALHDELSATIDRLGLKPTDTDHYAGAVGQYKIVATPTGIGASHATAATTQLLDQYRPCRGVLVGFAGGLDPALNTGKVIPVQWVTDQHGSTLQLGDNTPRFLETGHDRPVERSLLTVDHMVQSIDAKQTLFKRHRCAAVDMETYHVACVFAQRGVPLAVWRVVTDPATMAMPAQSLDWVKPDGRADPIAALKYLAARPWRLPWLLRLRQNARLGARRLAEQVEQALAE